MTAPRLPRPFPRAALLVAPLLVGLFAPPARAQARSPRDLDPAQYIESMRNFLEVVERLTGMARDPAASGVAAAITANEVLRARSPDEAIKYFVQILPEVKNEAVQRSVRLLLVDLYRGTNQTDKAMEQLRYLMVTAPPESFGPAPSGAPVAPVPPGGATPPANR